MSARKRKSPEPPEPKAVIYARVSTVKQGKSGVSLEDQLTRCREECVRRGITDVIEETDIQSGKDSERPGLKRALEALASGERNVLIASKLDRICRSTVDTLKLAERSKKGGWNLLILDGSVQFDTTSPHGKLMLTMIAALAEWERELIVERIRAANAHRRRRGDSDLIPPDVEARIIKMYYKDGKSLRAIARHFNETGVPSARGGIWIAATIARVLDRAQL